MNQIERIERMERYLNESEQAVKALSDALEQYEAAQKALKKLSDYYGSTLWMSDFEADEAGLLPAGLKRGVLSEDGVYDVLSDHYALTVRLLDTVSSILKNR